MSTNPQTATSERPPDYGRLTVRDVRSSCLRIALKYSRNRPHLFRLLKNSSLIACFAVSLCITESLFKLTDEIFEETEVDVNIHAALSGDASVMESEQTSISTMRTVLEQRGIAVDHTVARDEIDRLLKASGRLTPEEILHAEKVLAHNKNFKASDSPDAQLHRMIVSDQWDPDNYSVSHDGALSIVFSSESAFVEQVDDNKDSVWLLAVIVPTRLETLSRGIDSSRTYGDSVVTSEVWGQLVHMYKPFGFKLGLLDCRVVQSVCIDRGFIAADLVLALPKGDDRIKDAVQFRPYPRQRTRSCPAKASCSTSAHAIRHIRAWLTSLLSERVPDINNAELLIPASLRSSGLGLQSKKLKFQWFPWLQQRPQPLHFLWIPSTHSSGPQTPTTRCDDAPPMVVSALSVPFTGRVRFGTIRKPVSTSFNTNQHVPLWSPSDLLHTLNCPLHATYVIITPEAKCLAFGEQKGEYPTYNNMAFYLRFLYPSVDDCMLSFVFFVNLLVLLNSALDAGVILSHSRLRTSSRSASLSASLTSNRLNLARAVFRLARRGWTSHTPSRHFVTGVDSLPQSPTGSSTNTFVYRKHLIVFCKNFCLDFLSSNFLILITILPLINFLNLSHASSLVNISLFILRWLATSFPVISLRLSIVCGRLNCARFAMFVFFLWVSLVFISFYFYSAVHSAHIPRRRRRNSRRISYSSLQHLCNRPADQVVDELTRLLLVASDTDTHRGRTASSNTSSTTEPDTQPHCHASSVFNDDTILTAHSFPEATHLLHRLNSLHQLLLDGEHIINSSTSLAPALASSNLSESEQRTRTAPNAAPAHIYTWQFAGFSTVGHTSETTTITECDRTSESANRKIPNHSTYSRFSSCPDPCSGSLTVSGAYEAEDEQDTSDVESTNCTIVRRRFRRHRPRLLSRSHSSTSHSSSELEDISGHSVDRMSVTNWPLWVIHCESCVVCWRTFRPHVRLGALPCGHGFHEACIRRWLDTGALDCPVCRWPAYAPHLRQQRQMIGQLLAAVRSTLPTTTTQHNNATASIVS